VASRSKQWLDSWFIDNIRVGHFAGVMMVYQQSLDYHLHGRPLWMEPANGEKYTSTSIVGYVMKDSTLLDGGQPPDNVADIECVKTKSGSSIYLTGGPFLQYE
jgi:hypothetical protein